MSTLHVWLPPNYLRWGGPNIGSYLNVFLLIHCFLVGPGERWYLGGSAEIGGGSKTLLQPSLHSLSLPPKTIIIREPCSQ